MSNSPRFSLFFPFCDELQLLPIAIREALRVLAPIDGGFEILLVDDGSTDGSELIAEELANEHPQVRLVKHPQNLGYGAVLTTGFRAAKGSIVAYSDVDMPAPLQLFVEALPLLEGADGADLVVGYPTGVTKPIHRHLYTWGYGRMVQALLALHVKDVNFSFKLLRRSLVDELELGAATGFIDAQLLAEVRARGGRRIEIPIPFQPRRAGRSHFDSPITAWKTGAELLRYWRTQRGKGSRLRVDPEPEPSSSS